MRRGLEVIVIAYGPGGLLPSGLKDLAMHYTVTVVDNSSSNATRSAVERVGARYLDPGCNLGFGAGVNYALRIRPNSEDDVLLLNPDASIEITAIERLRQALTERPRTACVAPAQHAPGDEGWDRVRWPFPTPRQAWRDAFGLGRGGHSGGFVIGSILLLSAEAIAAVGGFDERFFLYAEETDWQRRAVELGWSIADCPDVVALHEGGATGGDPELRERLFHASHELYVRKWHGVLGWQIDRAAIIFGAAARAIVQSGQRRRAAKARLSLYLQGPMRVLERGWSRPVSRVNLQPPREGRRPLRIAQVVCTDHFAGVERYVVTLSIGLMEKGCAVTVIGGSRERMVTELGDGVAWRPGATTIAATLRLLVSGEFDVVHAHMSNAELAAILAEFSHRGAVVATRHFAQRRGSSAVARQVGRHVARRLDCQLAISRFVAEAIEGPSVTIEPGVPNVPDQPTAVPRRPVVLMVQRLEAEKRTEVGLRAFQISDLHRHGWTLVVAGGGSEMGPMMELARELGIEDSCRFLGPQVDVQRLYEEASIFLATRPDEPFGLSVVEAMANALPVVAAGGGGHVESVGQDPAAMLFPAGDAESGAKMLVELAGDPAGREAYGLRLRSIQETQFSADRQVERTLEIYRSLIGGDSKDGARRER